jgi:hypothetical protein
MKIRLIAILILTIIVAACQAMPEREILMEVTVEVTRVVIVTATSPQESGPLPLVSPEADTTQTQAVPTQLTEVPREPSSTPTLGPTATPDVFPTPIVGQIFVAQQTFQRGEMFWLQPIDQIWVLTTDGNGVQTWIVQDDIFEDGMPESDESLVAPEEGLIQPIRGFGMLWRNDLNIQNMLGWATGAELGYLTNYEYHWGGTVNDAGEYVAGPGYHVVETFIGNVYRFDEATRTWEIIRQSD